uniref:RNase H type-1 domain-containing protein n=1 Tax=Chenopodium quinoa TaxID=63459 RepID=A0A803LJ02_CHEQI
MYTIEKANTASSTPVHLSSAVSNKWKAPSVGFYKLNSDVARFSNDDMTGLGGVIRDSVGEVMAATYWCIKGCYEVDVGEALAARHGLSIAIEAGLNRITLETDSMKLYKPSYCENSAF